VIWEPTLPGKQCYVRAELVDGYKVLTEATPEQKKSQRSTWSQLQAIADMKFTYVAACQMYGEQKRRGHHSATEILKLMLKYFFYLTSCLAISAPFKNRPNLCET